MTNTERRWSMIALLLANFIGGLDTTMLNTALPQIMNDLDGVNQLGLLTSILLFFVAVTTVIWGKIGERIGNKKTFQIATVIFIIGSIIGGAAWNIWVMIIGRGLMGLGIGGMVSIPYIIYADLFPDAKSRAAALGWVTAFYSVASVLGPIAGGLVVDSLGWPWVFYSLIPFGAVSIILLQLFYKETASDREKTTVDVWGSALLVLISGMLLFWIDNISRLSILQHVLIIILLGAMIVLLVLIESKVNDPILPLEMLKNRPYLLKNSLMVLVYGFTIGYSIYAPMWAQNNLHTNATLAGATQIMSSRAVIIATRIASGLLNKISFKNMITIGYLSVLISAALMAFAPKDASYLYIAVSGAFLGLGQGFIFPPAQVAFQEDVAPDHINIATTFSLLMRTLGQTFMASIYGVLYAITISNVLADNSDASRDLINQLPSLDTTAVSANLLDILETIVYNGFHFIFIIALVLVGLVLIVNQFAWNSYKTNDVEPHLSN